MRLSLLLCLVLALPRMVSADESAHVRLPLSIRSTEQMSPDSRELLFWFLCSSRDWRVSDSGGALVAEYRHVSRLLTNSEGDMDSFRCSLSVRFSPYEHSSPVWLREGSFTSAKAADGTVLLSPIADSTSQKTKVFSTRLILSLAPDLWVETYERSPNMERSATTNALALVASLLSSVVRGRSALNDQLASDGSRVVQNDASVPTPVRDLRVERVAPGQYQLSGYVNPKRRGFIDVAIQDPQTGSIRNQAKIQRTVEWTGWSTDPAELFYFDIPITADGDGTAQQVRLLVRFTPRESTVLCSTNCVIETWSR